MLAQAEPSIVVLGSNWGSAAEISAITDKLLAASKTVVVIMPLLNFGFDLPQRWIENQIRAGKAATFGFLVGQVMKATAGKANPKRVNELLKRALDALPA